MEHHLFYFFGNHCDFDFLGNSHVDSLIVYILTPCIFQVDCIVTTAGGIEEDLMKCMAPSYLGEFSLCGTELRKKGINRIGNLLVPNNNYCSLEEWILPVWDKMLEEQKSQVSNIFH